MNENVESLKKIADGDQGGTFGAMFGAAKAVVKDEEVHIVSEHQIYTHNARCSSLMSSLGL
jgi:hypothetical protein